jgi:urocanate hydratase
MQVMIDNNLDFDVALYPYELVTYGESGQVCQNWMQYRLIKRYLEIMDDTQTLVVSSGHPARALSPHRRKRHGPSSPTASWWGCSTPRRTSIAWPLWAASTTGR